LAELERRGPVSRAARLVCVLCVAAPAGRVLFETRGTLEAVVAHAPRGEHGFGYDSLLYLPDVAKTLAELTPDELNARSHRGTAARALHAWLRTLPAGSLDAAR
ncbi:MAG TPA: non-canonical purine NTP pyrophosphatase, partial [Polyangiaceae bacterium]|nr:non-canonical purine NTP pyrophosphatase [Polyangiaceae bacterium]